MKDEVLLSKADTIERCVRRVREEYVGHEQEFEDNFTRQDAIVLNLQRAGVLDRPAAAAMMAMVGFRNVAVHEYQELDLRKVRHIIEHRLDDLLAFSKAVLQADASG